MKPKPEVRVLAKQLFEAGRVQKKKIMPWWDSSWDDFEPESLKAWDAVAREAIRRLKK